MKPLRDGPGCCGHRSGRHVRSEDLRLHDAANGERKIAAKLGACAIDFHQSSNDWIVLIDADEALDAGIWQIKKAGPRYDATRGRGWPSIWGDGSYPTLGLEPVQESVRVSGSVGALESNLLHFTCDSLAEHLRTMDRYTTLAAEQLIDQKIGVSWRQGFRDGVEGLCIAYMAAFYNFLKYAKARFMRTGRP